MVKISLTEGPMERCLMDMPSEILFEIFRRLPKRYLMRVSKLCSKLRDVAGDTRLWKDVYIKYYSKDKNGIVAYEELYSQPSPVNVVDSSDTCLMSPVSLQIDQVVKVTELNLSSITTQDKCTMEAIFAKYQCTKLYLDFNIFVGLKGCITDIAPETFLKQSALEVLGVANHRYMSNMKEVTIWLAQVLSNCKNLKTLDLRHTYLTNSGMLSLLNSMPTFLEKLLLKGTFPEDSFFKSLAKMRPNLKELGLAFVGVLFPSLLEFQFLKTLQITLLEYMNIDSLYMYLIKFPSALKTVYVDTHENKSLFEDGPQIDLEVKVEELRGKLEPHGIMIKIVDLDEVGPKFDANDNNCWLVQKDMYFVTF